MSGEDRLARELVEAFDDPEPRVELRAETLGDLYTAVELARVSLVELSKLLASPATALACEHTAIRLAHALAACHDQQRSAS